MANTQAVKQLPCSQCPHGARCCSFGASLELDESDAIIAAHGPMYVKRTDDPSDPIRTATFGGACVFLSSRTNKCTIHDKSYYPRVCRGFPFDDGTGKPYAGDVTICPEMQEENISG